MSNGDLSGTSENIRGIIGPPWGGAIAPCHMRSSHMIPLNTQNFGRMVERIFSRALLEMLDNNKVCVILLLGCAEKKEKFI